MNGQRFFQSSKRPLFLAFLSVLVMLAIMSPATSRADHDGGDIERFVRARIDISESMIDFFRKGGRPQFGPDGGPSMEELRKLETRINSHITKILSKYDLSIDDYQSQKEDVFSDEAGVADFLSAHPDLEKRYKALPQSPRRGRPRH